MPNRKLTPTYIAAHIRRVLKDGGSAPHSEEVQWFFKEEITSRGWYTDELRKVARRFHRALVSENGLEYLVRVTDQLFRGDVLEEKAMAVYMLQPSLDQLTEKDFQLFERWLGRISSWADHDALVSYLIGPMIVTQPERVARVFAWGGSKNRWRRRAAAVALIRGARQRMFVNEIACLTDLLLGDKDDMVQKGLGWLLREYTKYNRAEAIPLLMRIRRHAPRLVLRTACETLGATDRASILTRDR